MSNNIKYAELEPDGAPDVDSFNIDDEDPEFQERSNMVNFDGVVLFVDSTDWRESSLLKAQLVAAGLIFTLFGLAELTVGTVITKIQEDYEVNDLHVSLIFLSSVLGYFIMALLSEFTHKNLGLRGVVVLGSCSMSLAYLIISTKPWFPILLLCYVLAGIGCGLLDASLNTWMGRLVDSNQLLGMLHGCFGLGCMISPPLITALLERKNHPLVWNQFYIIITGIASCIVISLIITFKYELAAKFRYVINKDHHDQKENVGIELDSIDSPSTPDSEGSPGSPSGSASSTLKDEVASATLLETLKSPLVWTFAFVLFVYVGSETSFGAWLITYLLRIKKLDYKQSSYIASSFWFGLTLGRMVLGFATVHFFKNELTANTFYIVGSFIGALTFAFLSTTELFALYYICVFFTGILVGPVFPTTIVCTLKVLPAKYHAAGVGFICAFGGGAAGLPFIIGVIAELSGSGLRGFPIIVTVMFGLLLIIWMFAYQRQKGTYGSVRVR